MCKEYNGWANYPTWNVALWLDNDRGLYESALDIARMEFDYETQRDSHYKEFIQEIMTHGDDNGTGMEADLLGYVLAIVDWRAISEAYKEQAA